MVLRSPMPDLVIPQITLSQYMFTHLARRGNKVAIVESGNNDKKYTYNKVRENAMKCGSAFYRMGLEKGDVVATCLTNCAEFTFIVMGVNACGGILTTLNPNYTKAELAYQLKQTRPKFVFGNSGNFEKLKDVCDSLPSVKALISMENVPAHQTFASFMDKGNHKDFPLDVQVYPEDVAMIAYSSGTTGMPKGVMLTNKNFLASFTILDVVARSNLSDVVYLVLPMFHMFGIAMSMLVMVHGGRLILKKRFDFKQMLKDIEKYKITRFSAAPPIIVALNQLPENHGYDLSTLKLVGSGAAPLAESVALSVSKKMNIKIRQGWGLTEGGPATAHIDESTPISSVGQIAPNTLLKIVDPDSGKELGPNRDGEIWIKGPQVMKGYFKNPEATARTIDSEGWLHTGDIGHYDDNEFIYIVDRLKELIKYKGFQVAPAELEEVLLRHPKIVDVGVIGVPDLEAGELPKAYVVKKDPTLTEKEIHEFLKNKLSSYKYLRGGITFIDTIPKSPSGKILRRVLRNLETKQMPSKY